MISYILWDASPEIFTIPEFLGIGPLPVRWYGLLFALGFLVGQQIVIYIFKKEGRSLEDIDALTLYMVLSIVIGARIGHFLFYEPETLFKNPLEVLIPPYSGLASHGAVIGVIIGLLIYARSRRGTGQTFLYVLDRIIITVALGGSFIRFGNLMNSEIVGKPTDVPWGFIFVRNMEFRQIPRHPAQLYESISCFILVFVLFWIWNKYKAATPRGLMVGVFLVWVFTLRFLYEFLKENQEAFEANYALNMGQILSIPAVLLGIFFIFRSLKNPLEQIPAKAQ
jgi:phosphatidylglycerol---prolipoprotein diacylglyceryl transferase